LQEAVQQFLSKKRIAVAGVARGGGAVGNIIVKKLRGAGYEVFPVNPNATEIEGDRCYPDLRSIPGGVEAVVVATHPSVTDRVVRDCADLGIKLVWMHRAFGTGSVSPEAAAYGRMRGVTVIAGGCPMMYCEPVDVGHKCFRWILKWTGGLPKEA
jgi:predicted CoA-binding protein